MPGLGPAAVVAPPPATAPLHSLAVSGQTVNESNDRWTLGYQFCPETCFDANLWDPTCIGSHTQKCAPEPNPPCVEYLPFVIESPFECSSTGVTAGDYKGRARRQLEAATPNAFEHEFWTGELIPTNPHLAQPSAVVLNPTPGTPVPSIWGLAALNQYLASCGPGGRGTIHAPAFIATNWGRDFLIDDGPRLVTRVKRNVVVAGGGYPGTGPDGAPPPDGSAWVYATSGQVQVRMTDVEVIPDTLAEALDRKTNAVTYRAERYASAAWDGCCLAAVLITTPSC